MTKVLIDTDVLLDFFLDRSHFSDDAAKLLELCKKGSILGFVTPLIIGNMYYLLRRNSGHEKVIEHLKLLLTFIDVIEIGKDSIIMALNSEFTDFEDAMQNYSAEFSKKINVIVTRNSKDYRKSNLSIMSPEIFLKGSMQM